MGSCFGPIFGGCHQGPITSTGPASFNLASWAWESGPARLFFKPNKIYWHVLYENDIMHFICTGTT